MITFVEFQENLPSGYFMDILIIQVHLLFGNGHFPHFEADFKKRSGYNGFLEIVFCDTCKYNRFLLYVSNNLNSTI